MNERNKSLVLIPDYLSVPNLSGQPSDAVIVGDPAKVPGQWQNDRFLDVLDPETRREVMQMVPETVRAAVMTPSLAFYRRMAELRDDCFYADLVQRLLGSGVQVSVVSGLERARVPRSAAAWIKELASDGVKIVYRDATADRVAARDLVTAADVAAAARQGLKELLAAPHAIITPYARDEAKERGVTILTGSGGRT